LFEEIVVGALGVEFFFASVKTRGNRVRFACRVRAKGADSHVHHAPPDIHFSLNADILKGLLAEAVLAKGLATSGDGAASRARRENSVDTRLAHLVVALRVDEESHVRVEIPRGLADGADFYHKIH
jgi:hypothetical protein